MVAETAPLIVATVCSLKARGQPSLLSSAYASLYYVIGHYVIFPRLHTYDAGVSISTRKSTCEPASTSACASIRIRNFFLLLVLVLASSCRTSTREMEVFFGGSGQINKICPVPL